MKIDSGHSGVSSGRDESGAVVTADTEQSDSFSAQVSVWRGDQSALILKLCLTSVMFYIYFVKQIFL